MLEVGWGGGGEVCYDLLKLRYSLQTFTKWLQGNSFFDDIIILNINHLTFN